MVLILDHIQSTADQLSARLFLEIAVSPSSLTLAIIIYDFKHAEFDEYPDRLVLVLCIILP